MESFKNIPNKTIPNITISDSTYSTEITRNKPTALIFMVDQSTSMKWEEIQYKGEFQTKAKVVTDMINSILSELINRCVKAEGVRDYFDVCLIGYGGKSAVESNILWEGSLEGKTWVTVSELKENAKYESRTVAKSIRGKVKYNDVNVPYWISPVANYKTPMLHAIQKAFDLSKSWIENGHQDCFPPTVINITDGMYSDGTQEEILQEATNLKALHTSDGNLLFLNCHISNDQSISLIFPSNINEIPSNEELAKDLFRMSSKMPKVYNNRISDEIKNEPDVHAKYIGMGYNMNMDDLFRLIDIGTTQTR